MRKLLILPPLIIIVLLTIIFITNGNRTGSRDDKSLKTPTQKEEFIKTFKNTCGNYIKNKNFCNTVPIEFTSGKTASGLTTYKLGDPNIILKFSFNESILHKNYTRIINHELTHAHILFKTHHQEEYTKLGENAKIFFKNYRGGDFTQLDAMEVLTDCVAYKNFHYDEGYAVESYYLSISKNIQEEGIEAACDGGMKLFKKYSR